MAERTATAQDESNDNINKDDSSRLFKPMVVISTPSIMIVPEAGSMIRKRARRS